MVLLFILYMEFRLENDILETDEITRSCEQKYCDDIQATENKNETVTEDDEKVLHVTVVYDSNASSDKVLVKRPRGRPRINDNPKEIKSQTTTDDLSSCRPVENSSEAEKHGIISDTCEKNICPKVAAHTVKHCSGAQYICQKCGKTFKTKSALSVHMLREEDVRNFKCSICDDSFITKVDLKRHEDAKHEIITGCTKCDQKLASARLLEKHLMDYHGEEIPVLKCRFCNYQTIKPSMLKQHESYKHIRNDATYKCPVCKIDIKHSGTFKVHMRIHLDEKPYKCDICTKVFRSSSQLSAHKKIHAEKSIMCKECSQMFKTRRHLIRHSIIHTKEKPFKCDHCSYSCNIKANLNKHMRLIHKILDYTTTPVKIVETDVETEKSDAFARGNEYAEKLLRQASFKNGFEITIEDLQSALKQKAANRTMSSESNTGVDKILKDSAYEMGDSSCQGIDSAGVKPFDDSAKLDHQIVVINQTDIDGNVSESFTIDANTGRLVPIENNSAESPSSCIGELSSAYSGAILHLDGKIYQLGSSSCNLLNDITVGESQQHLVITEADGDNGIGVEDVLPEDINLSESANEITVKNCVAEKETNDQIFFVI